MNHPYPAAVLLLALVLAWTPELTGAQEAAADTSSVSMEADEALPEDTEVFRLPEAGVNANQDTPELITREEMDRDDVNDLWEAVRYTPGVILSGGGRRNDSNFSVRGFGSDSVPVFVDGIVMANPYRGEGDGARFLTGDMESIEIEKGYSSELLGANTLGGAVLLRTAKPKKPFEASLKTSFDFDSILHYADATHVVSAGTKLEYFYAKAVFQYRDVDHYRLPEDFEPTTDNPQEKGDRLWSDSDDLKLTLMAGTTPIPDLDIWLAYVYQDSDKGLSPPDTNLRDYAIWEWPVWKRHSVSLNSIFAAGPLSFSALAYFDKYDNRLDEYYTLKAWQRGIHAPHSDYDEYSTGGRLTGTWEINSWNTLQGALTYKKEDHLGLRGSYKNEDDLTEEMHVNEDTWSVGMEHAINPWDPLTVKAGFGFDALIPNEYWNEENEYLKLLDASYFIVKTQDKFLYTWQAGAFYKITGDHELRLTYARKNHFPNMSQRYSTRFGSAMPNPNLGPEIANHFELGYRGYFGGIGDFIYALTVNAALYYSVITGKIVTVGWPNPHHPSASVDISRNLDSTAFWGFELAPEISLKKFLSTGMSFSWNQNTINHSQAGIKVLPYYPEITLNGYMVIKPLEVLSIIPRVEYTGSRFANTEGFEKLEAYFLAHLKVSYDFGKYITASVGVENIFDKYYEIRQYAPMAGRSFNISLTARY
ncbi:TonB-dependent receptor [Treponema primitia]|uniref:TonB-dependent receptor n=1 Tax=Treponema primitia TaxID=88058 RepID=UPI000255500F|nr:TonB-dependent receptor [Treponema primitia]